MKSYNFEYNKTKECENLIFGDDLKFRSIFKMHTFEKNYLFNND